MPCRKYKHGKRASLADDEEGDVAEKIAPIVGGSAPKNRAGALCGSEDMQKHKT
jgi:hypothetical protein